MVSKIDRFIFFELNVQEGKYEGQKNIKVMHTERQTFIGVPESDIGIFLIRKKVILYKDTTTEFKIWYEKQVNSMSEDQRKYKLKEV